MKNPIRVHLPILKDFNYPVLPSVLRVMGLTLFLIKKQFSTCFSSGAGSSIEGSGV